jgi:hypothetical protein
VKILSVIIFFFQVVAAGAQDYPFAKDFVRGAIIIKDSTIKTGRIKWFPDPGEKLKFRENENSKTIKYTPDELLGFSVDSLKFVSLFNFEVYAAQYALLGKKLTVKHTFGQLLDSGSYNIYFVSISEYNALSGVMQNYPNFLFEKKTDSGFKYAAYPFEIRMKDTKYENAKENLYVFFKDYPEIIDKIKSYRQQDNFYEIISLMKKLN